MPFINIIMKYNEIDLISPETSELLIRDIYTDIINPPYYGYKQLKIIILTFLTIIIEGIQLSIFSLMLIPLKEYFQITDNIVIMSSICL